MAITPNKTSISVFSPAKVNLFLSVLGPRDDDFHELVSLIAPVKFGDTISIEYSPQNQPHILTCNNPDLENADNLIFKGLEYFQKAGETQGSFRVHLDKKIPIGAGLGGGSSNASSILLALNTMFESPLSLSSLTEIASQIGSDCPIFIHQKPMIMKGRGEILESLDDSLLTSLRKIKLLIFKPSFSIETTWAYKQLKIHQSYSTRNQAQGIIEAWVDTLQSDSLKKITQGHLYNDFENITFKKYLALPALLDTLKEKFQLPCLLSGSGSACFALISGENNTSEIVETIKQSWGDDTFMIETQIL